MCSTTLLSLTFRSQSALRRPQPAKMILPPGRRNPSSEQWPNWGWLHLIPGIVDPDYRDIPS